MYSSGCLYLFNGGLTMGSDRNPLVTFGAIILLILGIVSIFTSYRSFRGNFYFNAGLIVLGGIVLLTALFSRVRGSMGLILGGLWLVAIGLLNYYRIGFVYDDLIMAAIPIMAALLMLFGI
jgi:hypothetical protein